MTKTKTKVKQGRGPTEFPGITEAATAFGVNRSSLWRAVKREWVLPRLEARYYRWLKTWKKKPAKGRTSRLATHLATKEPSK